MKRYDNDANRAAEELLTISKKATTAVPPKIKANGSCEDWNAFCRRLETFRMESKNRDSIAFSQLLECATEELNNIVRVECSSKSLR